MHFIPHIFYPTPAFATTWPFVFFNFFFEIEGQHANVKAHEAVDHLVSFMSSREEISQLGFKLPTSSTWPFHFI